MNVNGHTIALWTGVGASIIGMVGGYASFRGELKKQHEEVLAQAVQRQQRIDALNRRLEGIENHLQFIDETLPEHDRELARRIFAQVQQQMNQQQAQQVYYEKSAPVLAMKSVKKLEVPAVKETQ